MEPPRIPESRLDRLRDKVGSRRELWVLVAIAAILVFGGLALWFRGAPARIAPPASGGATTTSASPSPLGIVVHVAGEVRRPGLYTLPEGSRVADAIEAAGGPRRSADLDLLNLAELLVDGTKIEVLAAGEAPSAVSSTPSSSVPGMPAQVALNTADQVTLEQIPGIGPVKAAAIIAYREQAGSFTAIEDLLEVSGIGPATLESIRPYVTL